MRRSRHFARPKPSARAESILEGMADAHFVLDAEFRFVAANGAMERSVGLGLEELRGRSIW